MDTSVPPPPAPLPVGGWAPPPLRPGQLSPGWRLAFIAGWVGVMGGFGALWQACRIAGIAPWWLGPETDMRSVFVVALPFLAPLVTVLAGVAGLRSACYIGIVASFVTASFALGDLHFPGLAVVEGILGVCGLLISIAGLGGRMRAAPEIAVADTVTESVG
jgi:hypothetical protein